MSQVQMLVTGASGIVGLALSAEVISRGLAVQGVIRTSCDLPKGVKNIVVVIVDCSTN